MNPGSTFERVYRALKMDLLRGAFRPGETIEPKVIGAELFASITPVRDALHRLAGGRLIEASPHDGFRVPLMTENALRDLFRWQEQLALVALRTASLPADQLHKGALDVVAQARQIFAAIAGLSGSVELQHAMESALDRLEPVRHREPDFLPDLADEIGALGSAVESANQSLLRQQLARYRARRIRLVPDLITALMTRGDTA